MAALTAFRERRRRPARRPAPASGRLAREKAAFGRSFDLLPGNAIFGPLEKLAFAGPRIVIEFDDLDAVGELRFNNRLG
jgi:hypothetical protein